VRWATRARCHVDRTACAWPIRRLVDPDPSFVFVDNPDQVPGDATPFDMRGVDLSHHGGDCRFETLLKRYEPGDPALWDIARIVHEADLADERHEAPEAPGLDALIRGPGLLANDDHALLEQTDRPHDGLYELRRRARAGGRLP